jgi:tetratricopeptide (TPR) repeat protein
MRNSAIAEGMVMVGEVAVAGCLYQAGCFHYGLGHVSLIIGEVHKAETLFRKAISKRPCGRYYKDLGMLLACDKHSFDEAEPVLRKAAGYDPNNSAVHYLLGTVLEAGAKRDEAEIEYREAVLCNSDDAHAHWHLGNFLHVHKHNYREAEKHFSEALRCQPDLLVAHLSLAELFEDHAETYKEAEKHYREIIECENRIFVSLRRPEPLFCVRPEPLFCVARLRLSLLLIQHKKDYDEAELHVREATKTIGLLSDRNAARAAGMLGYIMLHGHQNVDGAADQYREALRLNPRAGVWYTKLSILLAAKGDAGAAEKLRDDAMLLYVSDPSAYSDLEEFLDIELC